MLQLTCRHSQVWFGMSEVDLAACGLGCTLRSLSHCSCASALLSWEALKPRQSLSETGCPSLEGACRGATWLAHLDFDELAADKIMCCCATGPSHAGGGPVLDLAQCTLEQATSDGDVCQEAAQGMDAPHLTAHAAVSAQAISCSMIGCKHKPCVYMIIL